MTLSGPALADVAGQECAEPWLALLEITHSGLPDPLRFVADRSDVTSGGLVYAAAAFALTLPDSTQGQTPRAELILDNATAELAALFRGLIGPPRVTIRIVRASTPDVVEQEWSGMQLAGAQITAQTIVARLEVSPLEVEPFPPARFDRRWPGVFSE